MPHCWLSRQIWAHHSLDMSSLEGFFQRLKSFQEMPTHISLHSWASHLSMKTSFPSIFWQPLPWTLLLLPIPTWKQHPFLTRGLGDLPNLHSSLLLRGYRISGDLEIHSGILIGTTEMEAKGLCADQTKATWRAMGSQQRRVMTGSSFMAARHKRGYSPRPSFKDSSVCHLDLMGLFCLFLGMPVHPSLDRADSSSTAHSQMSQSAVPPLDSMLSNRHNWEFFSCCKMGHLDPNSSLWLCSYGGLLKRFWLVEPWISSSCLQDWKGPAKDKWHVLRSS